jgi:hypothetical protein
LVKLVSDIPAGDGKIDNTFYSAYGNGESRHACFLAANLLTLYPFVIIFFQSPEILFLNVLQNEHPIKLKNVRKDNVLLQK